jgi:hypothetical protein
MGTATTLKGVFLLAALGASNTIAPLPYQYNPIYASVIGKYYEIKELNENYRPFQEESQLEIIVNVSKHLIKNSKNIESEFVEIVNNNFWDLV